ncbi:MAG: RidA family protein [Defluviitaleaceae bacterium]|nr:RidA family protein [Defluviitaleaceae bacterium]
MSKEIISTTNAPAAVGPYCQGVKANGFIYVSGQLPFEPATGELIQGSIGEKTAKILDNIKAVLEAGGSSMDKCVKMTVFLTDMNKFAEMNEVYKTYFADSLAARSTIQVSALPRFEEIEIEAIALA